VPFDPPRTASTWPPADLASDAGAAIRFSIGLEDPADLIADLDRALAAMDDR
jgi:cysteine-S-conjugate beta-lyase